jgi:hypothetical protein
MPNTDRSAASRPRVTRERKLLAAGMLAGAAVGTWASTRTRNGAQIEGKPPVLIDWEQARGIAVRMNRGLALTSVERDRLDTYYQELVQRCIPIVADYRGP